VPDAFDFLGTTHIGLLYGESDSSIIFLSNISLICFSISALWASGGRYDLVLMILFSRKVMVCFVKLVQGRVSDSRSNTSM
jgi:hypothetical protein